MKPFSRGLICISNRPGSGQENELPVMLVREVGGFMMSYRIFIEVDYDIDRVAYPNNE